MKLLLAGVAAVALGFSPATQVKATLKAEQAAFNARKWSVLWKLHTPRYHSACKYGQFVAAEKRLRARGGRVTAKEIRVRVVSPTRALVDYLLVTQSHQKTHTTNDRYAKVGSRWLDDLDRGSIASLCHS